MSSNNLREAERVLTICNACRYCEGFCAVFPAMELRRTFTTGDLKYLANLCHNCRDCYYACQYAPPHEFSLNFPQAMAQLRNETYREFAWPDLFSGLFRHNGRILGAITLISTVLWLLVVLLLNGAGTLSEVHQGPGSFYRVVPYTAMILPFFILGGLVVISLWKSAGKFRQMTGAAQPLIDAKAGSRALWDVLRLKYLDGGGYGCNYPDERFSMIRRYFHHAVFYGFLCCLASTTIAAIYDHFLHIPAPYPLFSWPVLSGTIGGIAILAGTIGLLALKLGMDRAPADDQAFAMEVCFILLLHGVSLSGLVLLAFRDTGAMGTLLIIHLGLVTGFFITMPYSKFIHALYRYTALIRFAQENSDSDSRKT